MAHRVSRKTPKGGQRTLREIAVEMAMAGHLTSTGNPYTAAAVARTLEKPRSRRCRFLFSCHDV